MNIRDKLSLIQSKFKAKKSRFNNFGKYNFRSAEDILEALKPYNIENNVYFTGFEGKRYEKTQKQMLEYNQIGFRYPDRYATNKLDALNVASEESDLEKLQQMGSHLNDVNRNE
jgi:hypothetical protein